MGKELFMAWSLYPSPTCIKFLSNQATESYLKKDDLGKTHNVSFYQHLDSSSTGLGKLNLEI